MPTGCERRGGQGKGDLGQRPGVSHVLHSHVGGSRQHLEVPVHSQQERRWGVPDPLHYYLDGDRAAHVLHGDGVGAVLQQGKREDVRETVARPQG